MTISKVYYRLMNSVNTKIIGFAKYLSGQNGEVVFLTSGLVKKTHRRKGVQSKLVEKIIETEQPKIVSYSIQGTNQEAFFLAIAEGVHQKLINEVIRKHIDIKKQAQLGKTYLMNYFKALEQNKFYRAMQESIIEDAAFNTPTGKTLEKAGFDRVNITYEGLHRTDDGSKDLSIYLYFSKEKPNI